ncbi:MAG TPA: phosphatase PAP2 family protein [Ignavibacteria bacterium]|nr:phosphatase PAP2 family protein [Ignavibacteria bacterium]
MEFIQSIDAALFHFINSTLANPVTDRLMPFITERNNWFIFYSLVWLYIVFKGGTKGRVSALLIILVILISDQTADNIIKPFFHRIRPCHVLDDVHILINCSQSYAFPSNHAVNNFAAAALFSYFYPSMKSFLFTGAFIVSLSRVMCGVHYPFDIAGGALIGMAFAYLIIYLWKLIDKKFKIVVR